MQEYKRQVARLYDNKTIDQVGLNRILADEDGLFFNHNGIALEGETIETYRRRVKDEASLRRVLHALEQNTVRLGLMMLGTPTSEMHVLDAGCGAGGSGIMIHKSFGCRVEGFTLSPEQARFANQAAARHQCGGAVSFAVGDMHELPSRGASYDRIWACESTEHATDLEALFAEFARVAKPHARLTIIAWCATEDSALKRQIDGHYLTRIRPARAYLEAAADNGWRPLLQRDISRASAIYWMLRAECAAKTGSEAFMAPGFASRSVEYGAFAFERMA